ncbi:TolB family protein [Metabacillus endolithicus]|uniref:TolB family protein n=1 Tax=Metabacillus endolithicus TaxID=1535204 RepID=A0ABW5C2K0_9BACI|nr:transporter [Metabacillus endolithicus]UPG61626.1 transporter [Metabacillus endolithicus]
MDQSKEQYDLPKGKNTKSFLEIINIETGERKTLASFHKVIEAPNWTRDGKLIYNSDGHLYSFNLNTYENSLIETGFATSCNNDHVLSPDESQIAISHHTALDHQSRIYILPAKGGIPTLITPMAPSYLHGWSPDGKTLAYCAERNGQYDIYTIPAYGGEEKQLTDLPGLDDGPEYSPDGKHIWFNSTRSGLMQIWRMNADGSEQTRITFEESNNWFPHVSPDGEKVVYLAYKKGEVEPGDHPPNKDVELRIMSSTGGESRLLVKLFGGQGTINVNSWSPDSKQLAFVRYELN